MKLKNKLFFLLTWFICFLPSHGYAAYLIRDAEVEDYIREILDEILLVAEINPKGINIFIIKDDEINAAAGGSNVYVNTGLIQSAESYEVIQAVLAHEVGHLKASHSVNFGNNLNKSLMEALFYSAGGALIALTGGAATAVIAGLSLGYNVAEKNMLQYSRMQEMEADYYTVQFLKKLRSSGQGSLSIFQKFVNMQNKYVDASRLNKYSMTHPFPSERLQFFREQFAKISYKPTINERLQQKHLLVTAKLAGYFNNMQNNFPNVFMEEKLSKLYFYAFAYVRMQNYEFAQKIMNAIMEQDPNNPYFYETLAEIKLKEGKFVESIEFYKKALAVKPNNFHFLLGIAENYNLLKNYDLAINYMQQALKQEPYNPQIPFRLANLYDAKGEGLIARIYFLESEVLRQNYPKAKALLVYIKSDIKNNKKPLDPQNTNRLKDIEEFLKNK